MASPDFFKKVQIKLYKDFKFQDVENGYFDVCFKIGEKLLYAHKNILAAVSKPLDAMFADRWTTKDEPIELKEYSYDDYKELLTYIYSGSCALDDNNIFSLLDMAESYDIADFKSFCDAFLAKGPFTAVNVFQYVELARRYSLVQLDKVLKNYVVANFRALLESEEFMKGNKATVEAFVDYAGELSEGENEYCFSRVLEWAQKQAETKMKESNDENFDFHNGIYAELSGMLPRFKFSEMSLPFLHGTVAKHLYLFSGDELSKILLSTRKIIITVTNNQDQTITAKIPYDQEIFDVIFPLAKHSRLSAPHTNYDCWNSMQRRIPSTPSLLKENWKIPFYLVIRNKYVCLVPYIYLEDTDYLIAGMKIDDEFQRPSGCCYIKVSTNY